MREYGLFRKKLYAVGIFPPNLISFLTFLKSPRSSYFAIIDEILSGAFLFRNIGTG
jgi:hypothetical protein